MSKPDTQAASPSLHRILVVDDEEIVLVALRETLLRQGYQVVASPSAVEAVELLQQHTFSTIITDHQMPVMTGLEFLARAKEIQPDATRILITAVLNLSTVIDAINKGEIYRFVIKPWLREELLATLTNAVQRYELICKNSVLQAATLAMNEKLSRLNTDLGAQITHAAEQNRQLARLNEALEQNLQHSVELCLKTMETFYPTLGSQARRVFELCRAMADTLNLSDDQRQALEIAAWLHDIGLVGVPRTLIRKWEQAPQTLNEAEQAVIQHHPALGQELARFVHHLEAVGDAIRSHHERFDGRGYPDGLSGDNIPWLGRLLTVAVTYAESNYDPGVTLELIKQSTGNKLDPEAVRVLLRSLPKAAMPKKEREVTLSELQPGMILARGIYTANGILLIPDGQRLSETYIDKLRNHNRINPITQSLLVYC